MFHSKLHGCRLMQSIFFSRSNRKNHFMDPGAIKGHPVLICWISSVYIILIWTWLIRRDKNAHFLLFSWNSRVVHINVTSFYRKWFKPKKIPVKNHFNLTSVASAKFRVLCLIGKLLLYSVYLKVFMQSVGTRILWGYC